MKDKNSARHGREETLTSLMTNTQSNLQSSYLSKILPIRYLASCQASLLWEVAKKGEKCTSKIRSIPAFLTFLTPVSQKKVHIRQMDENLRETQVSFGFKHT